MPWFISLMMLPSSSSVRWGDRINGIYLGDAGFHLAHPATLSEGTSTGTKKLDKFSCAGRRRDDSLTNFQSSGVSA